MGESTLPTPNIDYPMKILKGRRERGKHRGNKKVKVGREKKERQKER
jgi:hypothetical protein